MRRPRRMRPLTVPGKLEPAGDLLVGEPVEEAEADHLLLRRGQRGDQRGDLPCVAARREFAGHVIVRGLLRDPRRALDRAGAQAPAGEIDRAVADDRRRPCQHRSARRRVCRARGPDRDEAVLDGVLGALALVADRQRGAIGDRRKPPVQLGQGSAVTVLDRVHQCGVARLCCGSPQRVPRGQSRCAENSSDPNYTADTIYCGWGLPPTPGLGTLGARQATLPPGRCLASDCALARRRYSCSTS